MQTETTTTTYRAAIRHRTEGLARPCNAGDLFLVTGGLQCGNCLAHNVPPLENMCVERTSDDKNCPLQAEINSERCWIHRLCSRGHEEHLDAEGGAS